MSKVKHTVFFLLVSLLVFSGLYCKDNSFQNKLLSLNNVVSVRKLENHSSNLQNKIFKSEYEIIFNQMLDWSNPDAGFFKQRVIVGLNDFNKNTAVSLEGYDFYEDENGEYCLDIVDEIPLIFDCNYISIEHRFYGKSVPDNLSVSEIENWSYLTTYNAAHDVHKIINEFKKIFNQKWIVYGVSKGGYMTNLQSMYFPSDADAYVSYVANCCNSLDDNRLYDFVHKEIGDSAFGKTDAANFRKLVETFQNWCYEHKKMIIPYLHIFDSSSAAYREFCNDDRLIDAVISEYAVNFWQYNPNFSDIKFFLNLPEDSDENIKLKSKAAVYLFQNAAALPEDLFSINSAMLPYYFQAYTELGNYKLDFSYLKKYSKNNDDFFDNVPVYFKYILSKEQMEEFKYDDSTYKKLIEWSNNTQNKVFMIYGGLDPWYSVRIPDNYTNQNIHIYVNQFENHNACISSFDKKIKEEIIETINECLK